MLSSIGHPARPDASETLAYPGIARTDNVNAYEERMGKLSRVQLEQLFDAAYDFASSDDLRAWLDNNPPEGAG
jgi:hypothetical protein